MIRSDQNFNQFNSLLDVLISLINKKEFPKNAFNDGRSNLDFINSTYASIEVQFQNHLNHNPSLVKKNSHLDFSLICIICEHNIKRHHPDLFNKESAIYTILLDRIMSSDKTEKEALIAIIYAKLDEANILFLNCLQFHGINDYRFIRMAKSGIPLTVPAELANRLSKYTCNHPTK